MWSSLTVNKVNLCPFPSSHYIRSAYTNLLAAAVKYLRDQWLPRGRQFLECFVKHYRNFGIRSSQGSEAQHFSCKVFFDNNLADLHTLLSRLQAMVNQKSIEWKQEYAREAAIRRHNDRNCPIRREIATRVTYRALDFIHSQFVMASSARLGTHDIGTCTGAFTSQYGLPCKHMLYELLRVDSSDTGVRVIVATRPLGLADVCKYWHLPQRLEEVDPLLGEEDPRVVARRGRPRNDAEENIVPPAGIVIRRSTGQRSWQRQPSSHEYLERAAPRPARRPQTQGRIARQLAAEEFAVVNSQEGGEPGAGRGSEQGDEEGNRQWNREGNGRGRERGRGRGRGRHNTGFQYEGMGVMDFSQ